jgi:hypothetical protein
MSYLRRYKCEFCGTKIWAKEAPMRCECEDEMGLDIYDTNIYKIPPPPYMTDDEKNDRYREQYRLNGYSWLHQPPRMFLGAFNGYPDRSGGN